jgi:hypothetical protein
MYRTVLTVAMVLRCSLSFGQSTACTPVSNGDQSHAEAEVRQFFEDISKADAKELEQLYADEFTATNASGQVLQQGCGNSRAGVGKAHFSVICIG